MCFSFMVSFLLLGAEFKDLIVSSRQINTERLLGGWGNKKNKTSLKAGKKNLLTLLHSQRNAADGQLLFGAI